MFILFLSCAEVFAQKTSKSDGLSESHSITWAKRELQGFSLKMWFSNQMVWGIEAWDSDLPPDNCGSYGIGASYPTGSCNEHLYGAGPVIAAIVDGVRMVTPGYDPTSGTKYILPELKDSLRNRIWKSARDSSSHPNRPIYDDDADGAIDEDELDGRDNDGDWNPSVDDLGSDGLPDSLETGCRGGYDPVRNPDPSFDNFDLVRFDSCNATFPRKSNRDRYTQNNRLQDHGEPHVDEDFAAYSDNDLIASATDTFRSPVYPSHRPMGVAVTQRSYAWKTSNADAIIVAEYAFTNVGRKQWRNTFVGFLVDPDIGPIDVASYYVHNYVAFDTSTQTAYAYNPVHRGSTPLGLTLLGASRPMSSPGIVFQWENSFPGPPLGDDSIGYQWLTCSGFEQECIKPDQRIPGDTRFSFTIGNVGEVNPGDQVRATFAWVTGPTIKEMLGNARKAREMYASRYFVMSTIRLARPEGEPLRLSWEQATSPYGDNVAYRVYSGTATMEFSDSIETTDTAMSFARPPAGQPVYYSVAAIDEHGNRSARSNEVTNVPPPPLGLRAIEQQISIQLLWDSATVDTPTYNVYRASHADSQFYFIGRAHSGRTTFVDRLRWGNVSYFYRVTVVDKDGLESKPGNTVEARLLPPSPPSQLFTGPDSDRIHLRWTPNTEGDLAGYFVYRLDPESTSVTKLTPNLLTEPRYVDTAVRPFARYTYHVKAVDTTEAVSEPSYERWLSTVRRRNAVLICNISPGAIRDSMRLFHDFLLRGVEHSTWRSAGYSWSSEELSKYSLVIVDEAGISNGYYSTRYPSGLEEYLMAGGKLLITGRKLASSGYPGFFTFLSEHFGIDQLLRLSTQADFVGATGTNGFPSLVVDPTKLDSIGGKLRFVERFANIPPERVLYSYRSNPVDSAAEGDPVGIRSVHPGEQAYFLSFPLYYLDLSSASALITKVLNDFKITGVEYGREPLPDSYRLYDAYPNPFNSSTRIEFDLPHASRVSLSVFDVLGRQVAFLADEDLEAGRHVRNWNASDFASGLYFCSFVATGNGVTMREVKKVLLTK